MIKVCAIDPEVMGEWKWFNFLEPHFGVAAGRLIAEFPKHWRRAVMERADDLVQKEVHKPLQRTRMEERMRADSFRRKLIGAGLEYNKELSWPKNAIGHTCFSLIVVPGENAGERICGIEALEFCAGGVETVRQRDVMKSHEETFRCAHQLICRARRVALVDPNFHIAADRWANAVLALLGRLGAERANDCLIEIHTERKADHDPVIHRKMWKQKLEGKVPSRVRVRCIYWDKLPDDRIMHPRYLLTDRGGMHYDNGFDPQPGRKQQVTLLDDAYWEKLTAIYNGDQLPPEFDCARFLIE